MPSDERFLFGTQILDSDGVEVGKISVEQQQILLRTLLKQANLYEGASELTTAEFEASRKAFFVLQDVPPADRIRKFAEIAKQQAKDIVARRKEVLHPPAFGPIPLSQFVARAKPEAE